MCGGKWRSSIGPIQNGYTHFTGAHCRCRMRLTVSRRQLVERISGVEHQLRDVVAAAVRDGEWDLVRSLSDAAQLLSSWVPEDQQGSPASTNRRNTKRGRVSAYPRFEVENDQLVKIGWSKKSRSEYRHKAPLHVVARVVGALLEESEGSGGRFSTDGLFPLPPTGSDAEVPSYQGYLVLRWLRELGVVEKLGRIGYLLADPTILERRVGRELEEMGSKT